MSSKCITRGCGNAPIDGTRCALHGGLDSLGLENPQREEEGETEKREVFTAEEGTQPDDVAVNAEPSKPKHCKALNRHGEPCRSTSVGPDGLCGAHSGRSQLGTVEAARRAGEASGKARTARVAARARKLEDAKLGLADLLRLRALERKEELVAALIDAAVQGRDVPALRVVFDRLEGKVADVQIEGFTPEEVAMVERSREFRKLTELSSDELHARLRTDGDA
jgi:hypothetical protein